MYPTRLQVKTQFLGLLDDPAGTTYTDPIFQVAFQEAYDVLWEAMLTAQVPRIELLTYVTVNPYTTELTPADMGIADFGDYLYLSERTWGSSDKFIDLVSLDRLPQRAMTDRLLQFNWRNNTFYFVGATAMIELQVKYESSSQAPTSDGTVIALDSCLTFLANYAAGVAGPRKGDDVDAARCLNAAVGPKFNSGTMGGALFRLIQPLVRSRQNVQIAQKPFSATRRNLGNQFWQVPYVAAQQGTTGGGAQNVPIQFTTADGGITPAPDGVTNVFYIIVGVVSVSMLQWNGNTQTEGVDYTRINNQITFIQTPLPGAGDVLTAEVYIRTQ